MSIYLVCDFFFIKVLIKKISNDNLKCNTNWKKNIYDSLGNKAKKSVTMTVGDVLLMLVFWLLFKKFGYHNFVM